MTQLELKNIENFLSHDMITYHHLCDQLLYYFTIATNPLSATLGTFSSEAIQATMGLNGQH